MLRTDLTLRQDSVPHAHAPPYRVRVIERVERSVSAGQVS